MLKRMFALFLAMTMVFSMLPVSAFAADDEDVMETIEETEAPEEVTEPVTESETVPEETEVPEEIEPVETEEPTEEVPEETEIPAETEESEEPDEVEPEEPEEEDEEDTQMADSGTCGDSLTWTLDDDGTLTISGTGMMTNYYYSNNMDSSDAPWFDSEIPVKSVIIEDGVTSIGSNAFRSCEDLTNVTIPDSVTSIGAYAFGYCWKLPRVTIGSGVTSIGENAFYNCIRLEIIDFLGDMPKIYDDAFRWVCADAFYPVGNKTYAKAGQYGGIINWLEGRTGPCGDNLRWTIDGSTLIISGTGSMFDYSVEKKEDGYLWVTSAPWSRLASVNSIRIENGVTSIGANAFYGCEYQTSISIPNSVKSIGTDAFRCAHLYGPDAYYFTAINELYIDSLETWLNISFGNEYSNPSYGTEEGTKVYVNGTLIHALNIPSGTEHIPDYAFVNWKGITSVTIPNGVKSIGNGAFACIHQYLGPWYEEKYYKDYSTKVEELYISSIESWLKISLADRYSNPISATDGETKVFVNGKLLQELTIPADQRTIPQYAFTNWDSVGSVTIPDSVTSIGSEAFRDCSNLTSITLPDGVTSIGDYAFSGCNGLKSVTIPGKVKTIGNSAFRDCSSLATATIGSSVETIEENAFGDCLELKEIHFLGDLPLIRYNTFLHVTATAYYPFGNSTYQNVDNYGGNITWMTAPYGTCGENLTWVLDENGTLTISGNGAMNNYSSSGIPWYSKRSSIKTVVIEDGVTSIGNYAFDNCFSLTSVTIPDGVTSIGVAAFASTGLTSITIPDSVTSIGDEAFYLCESLTNITLPSGIRRIEEMTFYGCALKSITIPDGVTSIGVAAFMFCSSLTSVTIPDSVTSIGHNAFLACGCLTSVTIPDSVTSIDGATFAECFSLENVTIGKSVTSLGENAFLDCSSLTSITIPDSVTSIGKTAFEDCSSLEEIFFRGDKPEIAEDAFTGVTAAAYYPAGNKTYAHAGNYGGNLTWEAYGEKPNAFLIFGPDTLRGGASADYKAGEYASKQVVWTLRSQDASFASISASGKLTTKAVAETVDIVITACAKDDPEASSDYTVTLVPGAQSAVIEGAHFVNLSEGREIQLTGRVLPASAMQEGSWKSSSSAVAKVDENGVVTFQKAGTVTITFTASDGSKKAASVKITAGEPVTGLTIIGEDTLVSGGKTTLKITPKVKNLEWSSDNTDAATVSKSGAVTAKTVYETTVVTITAKTTDGSGVEAQHTITITPKPKDMAIWEDGQIVSGKTLYVDSDTKTVILAAMEGCKWTTSAAKVAEVDNGIVTIQKTGNATITAKSPDGKQSAKVTLKISKLVNTMTLTANGETTLTAGKGKVTIKAEVNSDAKTKTVTWASSDPSVASVSGKGVVTAKAGVIENTEVTITATAKDGSGVKESIRVMVIPAATAVNILSRNGLTTQDGIVIRAGEVLNGRTITLSKGAALDLGALVYPNAANAQANQNVTWKSSNAKTADVSPEGVVTALKKGTVTITVKTVDGKTNTVKIKVV